MNDKRKDIRGPKADEVESIQAARNAIDVTSAEPNRKKFWTDDRSRCLAALWTTTFQSVSRMEGLWMGSLWLFVAEAGEKKTFRYDSRSYQTQGGRSPYIAFELSAFSGLDWTEKTHAPACR